MGKINLHQLTTSNSKSMRLPKARRLHFTPGQIALAVIVLILAIFFTRVAVWEHAYIERMEGSKRDVTQSVLSPSSDDENVDRTEPAPAEVSEYHVAAGKPRYFSIPSVGINNARIVEIGLKSTGELATPNNIYNVGWYNASAMPGTNGVAVIDGHGGAPGIGVFGNLTLAKVGATITIELEPTTEGGTGKVYTYRIVDTATKPLGDEANQYMATAFESPEPGRGSLTLITCTGDYWLSSRTYSHRFFIRAVLEN